MTDIQDLIPAFLFIAAFLAAVFIFVLCIALLAACQERHPELDTFSTASTLNYNTLDNRSPRRPSADESYPVSGLTGSVGVSVAIQPPRLHHGWDAEDFQDYQRGRQLWRQGSQTRSPTAGNANSRSASSEKTVVQGMDDCDGSSTAVAAVDSGSESDMLFYMSPEDTEREMSTDSLPNRLYGLVSRSWQAWEDDVMGRSA